MGGIHEFLEFLGEVLGGEVLLDEFPDDFAVHDEVDQGDVFDVDDAAGDPDAEAVCVVTNDFGYAHEGCLQGGGA